MGLQDIAQIIESDKKTAVMADTWGHLAPKKNMSYRGFILFTATTYGDITTIDCEFNNLPDSPWLYESVTDFLFNLDMKLDLPPGYVYRWEGVFRNYKFNGKLHNMDLTRGEKIPLDRFGKV